MVDEYHASKYCSDIETETDVAVEAAITAEDVASLESLLQSEKDKLAAMPYQNSKAAIRRKDRITKLENQIVSGKAALNAAVSPDTVQPTANTNADANTAQNGIDTIKNGVAQGDNRGFDARGNEIEYELNDEAKETLAQKYMTPEIQAHIAAMMEMPQTIDDNSPERQQYRIAKADEYYDKYQAANKNREAYIVIGPPAAGKSTIADPLVERTGSILIDSDIIKMGDKARGFEGIPEYGDGIGANAVHEESAQIADGIFVKAIAHGDNLVYPKVGGSAKSIRELAQQLKKHGYTTTLILNELPIEKALERNNNRYNETGRLVRPDYLLSVGNKPIRTYLELQGEGVFDGYERYSNDVNRGEAPFRVLEADKERPVVLRRGGSGRQTSDGDIIETGRAGSSGEGTKVAPQFSPALKDLGANTPTPAELRQSKVYTNTYDKWLTDAEKAADSAENSVYAVSNKSDSIAMAKERVLASIVCTHPDGHNQSGNVHVHIVINSLQIENVPLLPYMNRPADTKAGCKRRLLNLSFPCQRGILSFLLFLFGGIVCEEIKLDCIIVFLRRVRFRQDMIFHNIHTADKQIPVHDPVEQLCHSTHYFARRLCVTVEVNRAVGLLWYLPP